MGTPCVSVGSPSLPLSDTPARADELDRADSLHPAEGLDELLQPPARPLRDEDLEAVHRIDLRMEHRPNLFEAMLDQPEVRLRGLLVDEGGQDQHARPGLLLPLRLVDEVPQRLPEGLGAARVPAPLHDLLEPPQGLRIEGHRHDRHAVIKEGASGIWRLLRTAHLLNKTPWVGRAWQGRPLECGIPGALPRRACCGWMASPSASMGGPSSRTSRSMSSGARPSRSWDPTAGGRPCSCAPSPASSPTRGPPSWGTPRNWAMALSTL